MEISSETAKEILAIENMIPKSSFELEKWYREQKEKLNRYIKDQSRVKIDRMTKKTIEPNLISIKQMKQGYLRMLDSIFGHRRQLYNAAVDELTVDNWRIVLKDGSEINGKEVGRWKIIESLEEDIIDISVEVKGKTHYAFICPKKGLNGLKKMQFSKRVGIDVVSTDGIFNNDAHYRLVTVYEDGEVIKRVFPNGEFEIEDRRKK